MQSLFINEMFSVCVGVGRINERREKSGAGGVIIPGELFNALTYSLKYRQLPGDALSMMYYMLDTASK